MASTMKVAAFSTSVYVKLVNSTGEVVSINSSYNPKITVSETNEEIDLSSSIYGGIIDLDGSKIVSKEITISINVNGTIVNWVGMLYEGR